MALADLWRSLALPMKLPHLLSIDGLLTAFVDATLLLLRYFFSLALPYYGRCYPGPNACMPFRSIWPRMGQADRTWRQNLWTSRDPLSKTQRNNETFSHNCADHWRNLIQLYWHCSPDRSRRVRGVGARSIPTIVKPSNLNWNAYGDSQNDIYDHSVACRVCGFDTRYGLHCFCHAPQPNGLLKWNFRQPPWSLRWWSCIWSLDASLTESRWSDWRWRWLNL